MKKKDESLFHMFQDPIMTMVAMIFLATLWMILPGKSKAKPSEYYQNKSEIDSLQVVLDDLDREINLHEIHARRMIRELAWIAKKLSDVKEDDKHQLDSIASEMSRRKDELQMKIQRKKGCLFDENLIMYAQY